MIPVRMCMAAGLAAASMFLVCAGMAQDSGAPGAPGAAPQQTPDAPGGQGQSYPWPVTLGLRVASVEQRIPVMDRVVLVPDEATYLDEISRWTIAAQWPVLIEDERWAPLFVRGFKPSNVVRRVDRAAPLPADTGARRAALQAAVARAWGGDPAVDSPSARFAAVGLVPAGIVIASTDDPAWTAAVALAAGRGQPLAFIDGPLGSPHESLSASAFAALSGEVDAAFRSSGYLFGALGDQLDACTICRTMAAKCTPNLPPSQRFSVPGAPATNPADPIAVTDALCRNGDGSRYALCGWIWGDAPHAAYMAMCSLFLPRQTITCVNSYGEGGQFQAWNMADLQQSFETQGYRIQPMVGRSATLRTWQRLGIGGMSVDALFVNSSGDCTSFDLGVPGQTPPENHAWMLDVPLLSKPLALQFIHSFSLQSPNLEYTVGARWLDHGVYAYVGSVHEPFLSAFVPARNVLDRTAAFVPFLVAARHWDGPFAVPWRITTIGDPLMLLAPPVRPVRARLAPDAAEPGATGASASRLVDLRASATELLRACQPDPTPEKFRRAFVELEKLGDDRVAADLWSIASAKGARAGCARAALGVLFRNRDPDAFMDAFGAVSDPDAASLDMLWSLWTPRLQGLDAADAVETLARFPRPMRPDVDLIRLAPAYARLRGSAAVRDLFLKTAERSKDASVQQALRAAALEY